MGETKYLLTKVFVRLLLYGFAFISGALGMQAGDADAAAQEIAAWAASAIFVVVGGLFDRWAQIRDLAKPPR